MKVVKHCARGHYRRNSFSAIRHNVAATLTFKDNLKGRRSRIHFSYARWHPSQCRNVPSVGEVVKFSVARASPKFRNRFINQERSFTVRWLYCQGKYIALFVFLCCSSDSNCTSIISKDTNINTNNSVADSVFRHWRSC